MYFVLSFTFWIALFLEKFTLLAKNLHCRRQWRHGQISPLLILFFRLRSLWSYHPSCLVILLSLCGLNPLQSHAPTLHHNPEGINFLIIVLIIVTTIVNGVSIRSCLVIKFDQLDCHHHIETITWDILSSNRGLQSLIFNCDLTIRWDWGQHSHFLQCLIFEMAFCCY